LSSKRRWLYVLKFRGAGGAESVDCKLLAGQIGRLAGLPVPEIVFAELPADLARTEPDAKFKVSSAQAPA